MLFLSRNLLFSLLFCALIVVLQLQSYLAIFLWLAAALVCLVRFPAMRAFLTTVILFGVGFALYLYSLSQLPASLPREVHVLLHRLALLWVLLPFFIQSRTAAMPLFLYRGKPDWHEQLYVPFIWFGFQHTRVKSFLLIALTVNIVSLLPFIWQNAAALPDIWLLALIFAFTNGILEELVWRGVLLSRFTEQMGEAWAVFLTSLGFGLQHDSLGMPWGACLAFTVGGFFYGGITVRSKSIIPAIIWHIMLNLFMVGSGFLFS